MRRGMEHKQAEEYVDHAMQDAREREFRKRDILIEQTKFRKELGDLKNCTPVDESCLLPGQDKAESARRRQGPLPENQ